MCQVISSSRFLENLFKDETYVVFLNTGWKGGIEELIMENLYRLIDDLENNGATIIMPNNEKMLDALTRMFLGKPWNNLKTSLPALLIIPGLPYGIEGDMPNPKLFIPLKQITERYKTIEEFFSELVCFFKFGDEDFLKRFEDMGSESKLLKYIINGTDLKPNFFGFGINLNYFLEKITTKKSLIRQNDKIDFGLFQDRILKIRNEIKNAH